MLSCDRETVHHSTFYLEMLVCVKFTKKNNKLSLYKCNYVILYIPTELSSLFLSCADHEWP